MDIDVMKRTTVDLNCDLGEETGNEALVMPYISSANIACGAHAGNEDTMRETIRQAARYKVAIGAHPGYPDKANFGRLPMQMEPEQVAALVYEQIKLLQTIAEKEGCELVHVKPHGALYNQAAHDIELARAIAAAIARADRKLLFYGMANSAMKTAAEEFGLSFVSEVFADRAYTREGELVSRKEIGAIIHGAEACTARVLQMILDHRVKSIDCVRIPIQADTVCIHGDNPEAIELAKAIHQNLVKNEIQIEAPSA